LTIVRVRWHIS